MFCAMLMMGISLAEAYEEIQVTGWRDDCREGDNDWEGSPPPKASI